MDDGIVHEASTHSAGWIRLALDEIQPHRRIGGRIARSKVCDYVPETRMVDSQEHRSVLIDDEALYVSIDLHYNTALIEHPQGANYGATLNDVVSGR